MEIFVTDQVCHDSHIRDDLFSIKGLPGTGQMGIVSDASEWLMEMISQCMDKLRGASCLDGYEVLKKQMVEQLTDFWIF